MNWIIETRKLTKIYPSQPGWPILKRPSADGHRAVDNVDLRVAKGELFGLVGPNGAGKTTLVKLLTTLIIPSCGTIRVMDRDIRQETFVKKSIGLATSDERSFYWRLTGRQNLQFFAGLNNIPNRVAARRIEETLEQVQLREVAGRRFHSYSTGMRQRLAIARAMLTEPKIIILDEPTKGLDPHSTANFHDLIKNHLIAKLGITVFLTSHQLKEVEELCDRIAVMNHGRIQACGAMDQLRELLGPMERYHLIVRGIGTDTLESINPLVNGNLKSSFDQDGTVTLTFNKDRQDDQLTRLIKQILKHNGKIESISCDPISLHTVFNHLTQGQDQTPKAQLSGQDDGVCFDDCDVGKISAQSGQEPVLNRRAHDKAGIRAWLISKARIAGALIKRDMLSETSYRFSFFMQIVEIFLTVVALYFLSKMLGQGAVEKHLLPYGGDYFSFALIGIAFYSYFNIGFSSFAAKLQEAQSTGTLEAMLSTPADLSTIVLGSSLWRFIMTSIRVMIFLVCGAFMFPDGLEAGNLPLAALIIILTVVSASSFGIVSASFIIVVKRGDPISWLFRSASWLMGGVVFPVTVLPIWMQKISLLLPTVYALKAMRMVLLKGATFGDVLPQIGALCVFCFLLLPISLATLKYAVKRSKREGTLTHY
jgi:ABC-type multidrug transport system ATPase subunit/ABC-type polysaccharide/polyol phosphate export permease